MKSALTLALSMVLAPCVLAEAGGDRPPGVLVETSLDQVRQSPDAYKHVWVRFPIQFSSIGDVQNPFFTRFVPSQFTNFHCWSADQPIWRKESYEDLFGMLFLSKENAQLEQLYKLRLYDRLWVTGVVRNVFQGKPWIEVTEFEGMSGAVNTATLAHLYRAESHMKRREWSRAVSELSLAPADGLPSFVLAEVHKNMGMCYLRMGEAGTAVAHLNSAVSIMENVDRDTQMLLETARQRPESQLDRAIDGSTLHEADRPMWEAFEDSSAQPGR